MQKTNERQTAYVKVEDLDGILESLTKKAMLYKHKDDEDMIEEMEFQVARFYVATFFSHSGRAPLVPHLSPAPIS